MSKLKVISLGAGRQSTYMLYNYKADLAIFADTGCEPKWVYDLLDKLKTTQDTPIVIVRTGDLIQDTLDYYDGKRKRVATIPYLTGNNGRVLRQCTYEYKIAPIRKYLRSIGAKDVEFLIGISLDEIQRIKQSNVKWITHSFSLIDDRVTISQIFKWYEDNQMVSPKQSSCVICPFHSHNYWKALNNNAPKEFAKAIDFDEKIRDHPRLNNKLYLYKKPIPLKDIDFSINENYLFPELLDECEGLCGL